MKKIFLLFILALPLLAFTQGDYQARIEHFRKKYRDNHGVVKGKDKMSLRFYPPDASYIITARFERIFEAPWFGMVTSSGEKKRYRVYGILHFTLHDTLAKLHVYESQDLMNSTTYADYLFIPFTDPSNGIETYENGRYIDVKKSDLESNSYTFDFNKAYNPYCAYVSNKYSCPLPPKENNLDIAIHAGEMKMANH